MLEDEEKGLQKEKDEKEKEKEKLKNHLDNLEEEKEKKIICFKKKKK